MPNVNDEPIEEQIDELPKLGELARIFDIPHSMIHYYERANLITGIVRDQYGRRRYTAESQDRLQLLLDLRDLGFQVGQVRLALEGDPADEDGTPEEQLEAQLERLDALEYLIDHRLRSGRRARRTVRELRAQLLE